MEQSGEIVLYLSDVGLYAKADAWYRGVKRYVSNWPGTLKFEVLWSTGSHNWADVRTDVWFEDHRGTRWWGTQYGYDSELCYCRLLKHARIINEELRALAINLGLWAGDMWPLQDQLQREAWEKAHG